MASLKAIRKRIGSVRNTQKVTRAMQMIAAARLRKAQMAALGARAYASHVKEIALRIAQRSGTQAHPFLQPSASTNVELLAITSDRGLCGGFNENLLRRLVDDWKGRAGVQVSCTVVGRKGRDFLRARGMRADAHVGFYDGLSMAKVLPIAEAIAEKFLAGVVGQVALVYNRFKSAISQDITFEPLLPMVTTPMSDEPTGSRGRARGNLSSEHGEREGGGQQALPVGGSATTEIGDPAKLGERRRQPGDPTCRLGGLPSPAARSAEGGSIRRREPEGTLAPAIDYKYEPDRDTVVNRLLTRSVGARIYQAMLESLASELAARMTAMDNATKNAVDMIHVLTMQFNRARQAAITKELMDIVNGAESLKK